MSYAIAYDIRFRCRWSLGGSRRPPGTGHRRVPGLVTAVVLLRDPAQSRVPATFGLHCPLLAAHVMLATVAMLSAAPQIIASLRRRQRSLHRRIGAATPFGPILLLSNITMAPLWLWFTISGYRAARQRRFADHRRHMIRSVALTSSIIGNRIGDVVPAFALQPLHDSVFHGDDVAFLWVVAGVTGWLG